MKTTQAILLAIESHWRAYGVGVRGGDLWRFACANVKNLSRSYVRSVVLRLAEREFVLADAERRWSITLDGLCVIYGKKPVDDAPPGTKVCRGCRRRKRISAFYRVKTDNPFRRQSYCKKCDNRRREMDGRPIGCAPRDWAERYIERHAGCG